MKYMTKKNLVTLLLFIFITIPVTDLRATESSDVLARVNGNAITSKDLDMELARVEKQAQMKQSPIPESQYPQIRAELLETLINRELLYEESVKNGYAVSPAELDSAVDGIQARFADRKGLKEALAAMGITEADFRIQVKKGLCIQKLLQKEVFEKIEVTEKESRSFYDNNPNLFQKPEQVRASHILIKAAQNDDDEKKAAARKKIEEIQLKIDAGEDFAQLARTYSEGPSRSQGGDLGYFDRKKMVKPFSDAAFQLQPGQVSPIVKTRFGYHLIKVVDRKPEAKLTYESIKNRLEESLKNKKMQAAAAEFVNRLKQGATIERISG